MFRFEHPEFLYFLGIIPLMILIFILVVIVRRRSLKKFGDPDLIERLMPDASKYKAVVKFSILMAAFLFFGIALANPQWGSKKESIKRKSSDIFIALDISRSMMAQDVRPNRLERSRQFIQKLIDELKGDRIGLILFAGNAYMQMPLTTDFSAAQLFVRSADPSLAPTQGTSITDAIKMAESSFDEKNQHQRALIVITDGENHEEEAIKEAASALDKGMLTFTVGVGTASGAPIPVFQNGRNTYKADKQGRQVISKMNENLLLEVAKAGGGKYYNIISGDGVIDAVRDRINRMEKQEFEQRNFSAYESYFQYFLAVGIFLLLLEFLISFRKNNWLRDKDIFKI